MFDEVVSDGPPYPDRIHQSVLVFDLVDRVTRAIVEWADSATAVVNDWSSLAPDPHGHTDAMRRIAQLRDLALGIVASHPPTADDALDTTAYRQRAAAV